VRFRRRHWLACAFALVCTPGLAASVEPGHAQVGAWGLDLDDRDPAVKPGDNFYLSQNGAWFARTEVSNGTPNAAYWRDLRALARQRVTAIVQEAAADRTLSVDSLAGKAAAFHRAYMDAAEIEARGSAPLQAELAAIRGADDRKKMAYLMGQVAGAGSNRPINLLALPLGRAMWGVQIGQDADYPDRYVIYLQQGGLLLPGPEYYVDAQFADVRREYQTYIADVLRWLQWPDAEQRAAQVIAFETRVAQASWSHEEMSDVVKTHNPMRVEELVRAAPGFDWQAFLAGADLRAADRLVVDAKPAFPRLAAVFADTQLDVLQARQAFALVDARAEVLPAAIAQEHFRFRTQLLAGQGGAAPPRAARAELALGMHLDELVGSLYVARHFSPAAKARVVQMSERMRLAFDARLAHLAWMSAPTRKLARAKLAQMRFHIGYPDKVEDYKTLRIAEDDAYGNLQRSAAYKWREKVRLLDRPFRNDAWGLTADYSNYSYQVATNTLEIPAALLQPPFFDANADAALNYGAIGSLIAQLMVNAFDPQGRHFDADGKQREWWTDQEVAYFDGQVKKLSGQYSAVEALPGLHVKGELIVSEALDDLGAVQIALDAYHAESRAHPAPPLDGFNAEQRYFLGRAQMWRAKFSPNFVRNQIATGANAPPFLRVNGPLRNTDAWYAAFDVKPGDALYLSPAERVHPW
jgi:putative endopeptidase